MLEIDAQNKIPFKADWLVATKRNVVVSGILMAKQEIFPTEQKRRFLFKVSINDDKILDNYVELRFSFESLYSAELNNPAHLRGKIVKKYRYIDGIIFAWRDGHSP